MIDLLTKRLAIFTSSKYSALLKQGLRGLERETLRVTAKGSLAMTPHPRKLGSALTNARITTDYSESLLEFITPAEHDIAIALECLDKIHRFTYSQLQNEFLWNASMPCNLPIEKNIPIAWYGTSHSGMFKHVYRRGLALRYSKTMQCIAGIHYNFSLNEKIWPLLHQLEKSNVLQQVSQRDYQSECYIALVRNFYRYSWLLMYLFGASPALAKNFLRNRSHQLQNLGADTLFLPYATSLRMSDLGYQSNVQASIKSNYNNLHDYIKNLLAATCKSYPPYEKIGIKLNGEWIQLNTNILQIEDEYYSIIRPKRIIINNERLVQALKIRGVQYIEVRCLDIDPFEPLSISLQTSRFLDVFLHFLAFEASALISDEEAKENYNNFAYTVKEGRRPGLKLHLAGKSISLQEWGLILLERMRPIAALLDRQFNQKQHTIALIAQQNKLFDVELTPSARVLRGIRANDNSFLKFVLQQTQKQASQFLSKPLAQKDNAIFFKMVHASLVAQDILESCQTGNFDEFIANQYI